MNKTIFNDRRPNMNWWTTQCSGCRCTVTMLVDNYPHGPNTVNYCPVCGAKTEGADPECLAEKNE